MIKDNQEQGTILKCTLCPSDKPTTEEIKEDINGKEKQVRNFFKCVNFSGTNIQFERTGYYTVCKSCLRAMCCNSLGELDRQKFIDTMKFLNKPFHQDLFDKCSTTVNDTLGEYMKRTGLRAYIKETFENSDGFNKTASSIFNSIPDVRSAEFLEGDKQSKADCIKLLGYDPFELENPKDKAKLYNTLVDYLDESTLADSFKIPVCIQIVATFNQIDKINQAISIYTADPNTIIKEASSIKTLMDSKKSMLTAILSMAKDNGISINYNNNKSKGAGTLNGIVKKLDEIGLEAAEVNLFDLETCEAMQQIANISNKSILDQLVLDENGYTDMIAQQKQMITKMDIQNMKLEEENRLLKIKIKTLENK